MQDNSQEDSEYLGIAKLSRCLELKVSTLYSLVEQKKIPHYKIGRLIRFRKSEVEAWMQGNKKEPVDVSHTAKKVLRVASGPARDINQVVKKAIADAKGTVYTASHGKPDQVRGPRKEV